MKTWSELSETRIELQPASKGQKVRMINTANNLVETLEGFLPGGFAEWGHDIQPDVMTSIKTATAELHSAAFGGDLQEFTHAISICSAVYRQSILMFHNWEKRQPRIAYSGTLQACEG